MPYSAKTVRTASNSCSLVSHTSAVMHWKSADTSILSSGKSMGSSCPSGPLCAGERGSLFDSRTHSGIGDEVSDATAGASTGSSCPSGPLCAGECGSLVNSQSHSEEIGAEPSATPSTEGRRGGEECV